MRARLTYLLRYFLLTVVVFMTAKVGFMLSHADTQSFSMGDVLRVLGHGLSLDVATSLYVLIVPLLACVVSLWVRVPRSVMPAYYAVIALVLSLAFVADTSLYAFWHFKLDASCLGYLETPTEAMASVSTGYLLWRLLLVVVVATGIFSAERRMDSLFATAVPADHNSAVANSALSALISKLSRTLVLLLLTPFIVLGIRGGLDESTTNIGQVYFSQNQFLNHAAVNPVFSFLASMEKTATDLPDYTFMDTDESEAIADSLYSVESIAPDTLLHTRRPNIVVVLMESAGAIFTELEGRPEVMPRLSRLMHEAVSFDSCYCNSWRTDRGTVCTWSGYPSFPTSSVMKMSAKTRLLPSLAKTLSAEGYHTAYIYGGDINFTNMRGYLMSTGFSQLHWKKDYSLSEQQTSEWGVRDDITFGTLFDMIQQLHAGGKSFLIGYSTLSSHQPWDVPLHQFDDPILNSFYYLDHCIGQFVDSLQQTPAWHNTLIVLLPDHSFPYGELTSADRQFHHIPMVWTGGAVSKPRRITTICNQTDLPATLLGQMGLSHDDFRFSRDVMGRNYRDHFAIHTYNNGLVMIDSTGMAVLDLDTHRPIMQGSSDSGRLLHTGKAILQAATRDLRDKN